MKVVVGLISGGKDSILALHLAQTFGHQVIAIAHLKPKIQYGEPRRLQKILPVETDSYMYQSVASEVVSQIAAQCLPDLQYFSRHIQGTPIKTDSNEYIPTLGDEVEDLYDLLVDVKTAIPDLQGVVSGAIESTYQCKRVEEVCARLGLVSIAPLWKWSQLYLFRYFVELHEEFDVRIVKSCTMGLDQTHLMKSLANLSDHLISQQFGINLCGEGGEYETLTLSCPGYSGRLNPEKWDIRLDSEKIITPVSSVVFRETIPWIPETNSQSFAERVSKSPALNAFKVALENDCLYTNCCGFQDPKDFKINYPALWAITDHLRAEVNDHLTDHLRAEVNADSVFHLSTTMWFPRCETANWLRRGNCLIIAPCEGLYPHNGSRPRSAGFELLLALRLLRFNLYEAGGSFESLLNNTVIVIHSPSDFNGEIPKFCTDFVGRNLNWSPETMNKTWRGDFAVSMDAAVLMNIRVVVSGGSVSIGKIEIENFYGGLGK